MKALVVNGAIASDPVGPLTSRRQFTAPDGTTYPAVMWDGWTDADWQAAFGPSAKVYNIQTGTVPAGKVATGGSSIVYDAQTDAVIDVPAVRDVPLADAKADRKAALAAKRWTQETAGLVINGLHVQTDDRTKMMLTAAKVDGGTVNWKTADGTFVTLTPTQVSAMFAAVRSYVQACFDNEHALANAIDAASTSADVAAIDIAAGWP